MSIDSISSQKANIRPQIILGSNSASRKEILTRNGILFKKTISADIDEKAHGDRTMYHPFDLVSAVAMAKTDAILPLLTKDDESNCVLLTADSVVVHENKVLEKPLNSAEATKFMKGYSNSQCSVYTGIILTNTETFHRVVGVDVSTVYFKNIPDSVIDQIVSEGNALHCAGGLMVEHPALQPHIESIEGSVEGVMGMPCDLLEALLVELRETQPQLEKQQAMDPVEEEEESEYMQ